MTGARIGPYEVVATLGQGGMGVVYEVRHPDLPRRLALKKIIASGVGPELLARFCREAELLARVRHPAVVTLHAFARTEKGEPYLVTDLVEGTNLKDLARGSPFAPDRAARTVATLARAVAAIHEQGILHRDLKPENVILRSDDTPVLLDFGLARDVDAQTLTQTGALVGTPAYMAPEQVAGGGALLGPRTDVYGLGAILFELLAGRPPFEGGAVQLLAAVVSHEPRWPSRDADVPPALEAILRRAMAKEPQRRHESAAELALELDAFLAGTARAPVGRGWILAATLAVLSLTAAGVAARILLRPTPPSPAPPPVHVATRPPPPSAATTVPKRFGPSDGVAPFRAAHAWLARNPGHPAARDVEKDLRLARDSKEPLARIAVDGPDGPNRLAFASPRHLLFTASDAATVVIGDLDLGTQRPILTAPGADVPLRALALRRLADGTLRVLVAADRAVYAATLAATDLDRGDARPLERLGGWPPPDFTIPGQEHHGLWALALSPDGRFAAAAGDYRVARIYDLTTRPPRVRDLDGVDYRVASVAFTPDGHVLAGTWVRREESRLHAFPLEPGAPPRATIKHFLPVDALALASTGDLAIGARGLLVQRRGRDSLDPGPANVSQHTEQVVLHEKRPHPLVYAATSKQTPNELAVVSFEPTDTKLVRRRPLAAGPIDALAISPDGALLAVDAHDGRSRVDVWAAGD